MKKEIADSKANDLRERNRQEAVRRSQAKLRGAKLSVLFVIIAGLGCYVVWSLRFQWPFYSPPAQETAPYNALGIDTASKIAPSFLEGRSAFELDVLRNEPYARHGFRFGKGRPDLLRHFSSFSWYAPNTDDQNIAYGRFSPLERDNVALILAYQRRNGLTTPKRPK